MSGWEDIICAECQTPNAVPVKRPAGEPMGCGACGAQLPLEPPLILDARPKPAKPSLAVISIQWVKAGELLPSGERNPRDMTLVGVDGLIGPVGAGDRILYLSAEKEASRG